MIDSRPYQSQFLISLDFFDCFVSRSAHRRLNNSWRGFFSFIIIQASPRLLGSRVMICCGGSHGHWAQVPETPSKSSDSHKPQPSTILVSCRRTRSCQRVWFSVGSASRLFGSGHNDLARGREGKLSAKTRIVSVELNRKHLATVCRLEGRC